MTIASSTTNPVAIVSDISERLSSEKPKRYMPASVPTRESGADRLGMRVAGRLRRKTKITSTTRTTARPSSNWTSLTEARIVPVWSERIVTSSPAGSDCSNFGNSALTASTTAITLEPGCRWTFRMIAGVRLAQPASSPFSGPPTTVATSDRPHRAAVPVGDDHVPVGVGRLQLIVVVDRAVLSRAVEIALRHIGVFGRDVRANIVDRQAVGGEGARIQLDAQGRPLPAGDRHQSNSRHLGELLPHAHVREILDLRERQGLRGEREGDHRRIGGIDLRIDRRRRQAGGKQVGRGVDRRLALPARRRRALCRARIGASLRRRPLS